MNARHAELDAHTELDAEIRAQAQQAKDYIAVKVGWFIRSGAQKRRREKERNHG